MTVRRFLPILMLCAFLSSQAKAQSASDKAALKGLAPVTVLGNTPAGNAALGANYAVTGGIQNGAIAQPTLLPFAEQQQQALRDVFITARNLAQLADGLGTTLEGAYVARAHYIDRQHFTNLSQTLADVIAYANATTSANSGSAKFFFANGTTDGKTPVAAEVRAILKQNGGSADMFGRAYDLQGGTPGADPYGNSRPFQTEPNLTRIIGFDYFHTPADNIVYNRGPMMNLVMSPSYPSGHTTYGYAGAILLAMLVPERYPQLMVRAAEYGNDRIIIGAHYAMDVLAGRTLALYDLAHLLANDPAYVAQPFKDVPAISDFQAAVKKARADMTAALEAGCGNKMEVCAKEDTGRFSDPATDEAFYAATQTYNLPVVYPKNAGVLEGVAKSAPEAGYLLTIAFPSLTLEQADEILTATEGPGGGFLDDGSSFGVYSRLNLYAAAKRAMDVAAAK
ncbi:MAG TPA: phosphatase PAP2 family protein [Candidatus Acidoferrales bacterium]|nr:phosphatase PAP2 family protein [Candidatus Acidoferrales bacterium]